MLYKVILLECIIVHRYKLFKISLFFLTATFLYNNHMKVNEIKKMNRRTIVYDKRYHMTPISLQSDSNSFRIDPFCYFRELRSEEIFRPILP